MPRLVCRHLAGRELLRRRLAVCRRIAARLANDPPGLLTFQESVLAVGGAAQTTTLRWEDDTQTAMDPADEPLHAHWRGARAGLP